MLLGNASAHDSRVRRKNATQGMNPCLTDMAEDDSLFITAAPALFGDDFAKKEKERDEELKCLNQATKTPYQMEWAVPHTQGTTPYHRDRCFHDRLGSDLPGSLNRRSLVKDREGDVHKLSRTPSGDLSSEILRQRRTGHNNPSENGQHHSNCLPQQIWGDIISN